MLIMESSQVPSALANPAAYLDPGSGSFLIQLIIAGFLALAVALRAFWSKIKGRKRDDKKTEDETDYDE